MEGGAGIDFYVSFDPLDSETAPQRWAALCKLSDAFAGGPEGRLPRFWIADFCLPPAQVKSATSKTQEWSLYART